MAKSQKEKVDSDHEEPSINFLKRNKLKKIAGVVLILFSFLLFISFLSYLNSAYADEVLVSTLSIDEFGNEISLGN